MDRRSFLAQAGMALAWAGIAINITGCGGEDDNPGSPGGSGDVSGSIGTNHGHSVRVTEVQLLDGGAVQLTMSGGGHSHTVSLSADQVMGIADGMQVLVTSSSNSGHSHTVTFN
jgi:hypothetical protein